MRDERRPCRKKSDREVECSDEGVAGSVAIFRGEMVSNEASILLVLVSDTVLREDDGLVALF